MMSLIALIMAYMIFVITQVIDLSGCDHEEAITGVGSTVCKKYKRIM